jgi:hypothetical protein
MIKQLLMKTPKQVVFAFGAVLFLFLLAGLLAMSFPNLNEQLAESAKHPSWESPASSPESSTGRVSEWGKRVIEHSKSNKVVGTSVAEEPSEWGKKVIERSNRNKQELSKSEATSASDAHSEPADSSAQSAPAASTERSGVISMLASWFEGKPPHDVIGDAAARRLLVPGVEYTGYKVTNNYTRHIQDEIYHVYDLDVSYDPIPGAWGPKESGTKEKTIAFVKRGNSWYWYDWSEPGMYDEVLSALGAGR